MAGSAIYKGLCPHCGTEDVAFTSVAQVKVIQNDAGQSLWNVFFACNRCVGGLVVQVLSSKWFGPDGLTENIAIPGKGWQSSNSVAEFEVVLSYPNPPAHIAPEHVPERIAATYIEASENLHRQKNETSQMLCRKALDLATKRLLPESKKKLYGRIEELRDAGRITPEMADWAHIVRDVGNDSVHDDSDVSRDDATELLAFTETFLMYAFTLPGMIEKRRKSESELQELS